jgi:nucleotide-binding universal stress UspA family protein
MFPPRTILFATDFSETSQRAFEVACALSRDYEARLVAVHVAALPPVVGFVEGVVPPPTAIDREEMIDQLQQLGQSCPEVHMKYRLLEGDAAAEVLRAAEESNCDLIVLGTHGRRGLGRLLMGSVAEQVVRKAPCPVLTVRMPVAAGELALAAGAQGAAMP